MHPPTACHRRPAKGRPIQYCAVELDGQLAAGPFELGAIAVQVDQRSPSDVDVNVELTV
jgi:hypothetical protein